MTQATATPELVERLRDERHVMQGDGLAALLATTSEAAAALEAQQARIAELECDVKAALREVGKHAREAGEAIGRLKMSEAAGIVDGWRERAEAAEALADRYEKALREIAANAKTMKNAKALVGPAETHRDPRIRRMWEKWSYGEGQTLWKIARQALSSQGRHEGGEG